MAVRSFRRSRLVIPLFISVMLLVVVAFLAQPGLGTKDSTYGFAVAITTGPATGITDHSATLNGSISMPEAKLNRNEVFALPISFFTSFVWGRASGGPYPFATPGTETTGGMFSETISGLQPSTTYFYKARSGAIILHINNSSVFANGLEYLYGNEMSFTTLDNNLLNMDSSSTTGTPPNVFTDMINVNQTIVSVNQPITISANILNKGDMEGGYTAQLKVNGYIEQVQTGVIPGSSYVPVNFTLTKAVPGTYTIDIGGKTATVTVIADEKGSSASSQLFVIVLACMVAAVIILGTMLVLRHRSTQ